MPTQKVRYIRQDDIPEVIADEERRIQKRERIREILGLCKCCETPIENGYHRFDEFVICAECYQILAGYYSSIEDDLEDGMFD